MPYWFHGTEEKNVRSILKNGFKSGTFFGKHLEETLTLGCSEAVFWVWFDKNPSEYWEWITRRTIGPKHIRVVARLNPEIIYENKELAVSMRRKFHKQDNPDTVFCEPCEGKGEFTEVPFFRVKNRKIEVCHHCGGFGCINPNGKKMNEE